MKIQTKVNDPGNIEITITTTMTLNEWEGLTRQLPENNWPACDLITGIRDATTLVRKNFTVEKEREF